MMVDQKVGAWDMGVMMRVNDQPTTSSITTCWGDRGAFQYTSNTVHPQQTSRSPPMEEKGPKI